MTAPIDNKLIDQFKGIVGDSGWIEDDSDLEPYLTEWRGLFRGTTPILLMPGSTDEVAQIISLCAQHEIAVVPQGGNTGLVGGAIPGLGERPEILISMRRMKALRELDADNFTVTVEAGYVLEELQNAVAEQGLLFPLSLASEGSCQIGGNLSTNAGGTNVLRYGNTRDLVLGIEAVLPDGSVYENLSGLRKDNTGYDLKQLFIGAEGTLGIITAATLKLFPAPRSSATALLAVSDPEAAVRLYGAARSQVGDDMVAFELMPRLAVEMVVEHISGARDPMDDACPWYVLLELANARSQTETDDVLTGFLESAIEQGLITDGIVASSEAQRKELWHLRHAISEAQKEAGGSIKHDISVPVSRMPEFLAAADPLMQELLPGCRPVPFGHLGDGNLHYNISQPVDMDKQAFTDRWHDFNTVVHELAISMGGSFSAEHGIGSLKASELERLSGDAKLKLMEAIKQALDPKGIMNPGKLLN